MSRNEIEKALWPKHSTHPKKASADARTADGIVFDSVPERRRYETLRDMQRVKAIRKLQVHTKFDLVVNQAHIAYYTCDFTYIDNATGELVVEDVKGFKRSKKTGKMLPRVEREFGLKCKLVKALFGLEVRIVQA